ncbi:hypothetical protein MTR67_017245 [Solanum verrucosum]|uniref:NAC domain-containing protein n=1 Tax=Solanum verrucosum TaxID=315347 RepID=A0AAF0TS25_SOLVR|nr:hypothetical protein MTR67_017245 [Solanum verrucosum]
MEFYDLSSIEKSGSSKATDNGGCSKATDKELMKYLVKYVIGKPFACKHTVMEDVDEVYGIRVFSPLQILETTQGMTTNTRCIITFQNKEKCKMFISKDTPGFWKPNPKIKSIFDSNDKHIGNIKISWYYYYDTNNGRRKSSKRLRKSEWHIREYYLSSKYLPPNKVERKHVILTMMMKTKEQKYGNSNNNNQGKSDKAMQIIQSPQGGHVQLDHKYDDAVGMSVENQIIMQSLQSLQLSDKAMQTIQSPQGGRVQVDHKNGDAVGMSVENQLIMQSLQSLQL